MNPRLSAFHVLTRIERDEAYSNLALMRELNNCSVKSYANEIGKEELRVLDANRRLITELVYGTLRSIRLLDYYVRHLSGRELIKIDPAVLRILRLSLYQLLFLDRIPAHAVLSEAGKLCRKVGKKHAVGFVNALLRRQLREQKACDKPNFPADEITKLCIKQSLPDWLVQRWQNELEESGETNPKKILGKLQERAEHLNKPAPLFLLPNTCKISRDELIDKLNQMGLEAIAGEFAPDSIVLKTGGISPVVPLVKDGLVTVMDEAAQLVGVLMGLKSGDHLLDLCAAPGGKSLFGAAMVGKSGKVVSVDISAKKLGMLKHQSTAHGFDWLHTIKADSSQIIESIEPHSFDKVLVDAPCSALGIIRRHPEIRWRRKAGDIFILADKARQIAETASHYLKPGGSIIFSVCTETYEEGVSQLEILSELTGFEAVTEPLIHKAFWKNHNQKPYLDTSRIPTLDGFIAFKLRSAN